MRWMYPFERYMKKLKNCVRNKACPEGSIVEGYVMDEALTFCSKYLKGVETRFNRPDRNVDVVPSLSKLSVFRSQGRLIGKKQLRPLAEEEKKTAEWYVLNNCAEIAPYVQLGSPEASDELFSLASGSSNLVASYPGCVVIVVRFLCLKRDENKKTQNNGVSVVGVENKTYYRQLEEVIVMSYLEHLEDIEVDVMHDTTSNGFQLLADLGPLLEINFQRIGAPTEFVDIDNNPPDEDDMDEVEEEDIDEVDDEEMEEVVEEDKKEVEEEDEDDNENNAKIDNLEEIYTDDDYYSDE
uniref:DUF4218 domain-containing protein n=1 Tax=Cannabis sativa TaxID=3483 RepID=A0A803PLT5_CANSA